MTVINCAECLRERREKGQPPYLNLWEWLALDRISADTVYKGTALCAKHFQEAIAKESKDKQ